jgi:hypothetical protein
VFLFVKFIRKSETLIGTLCLFFQKIFINKCYGFYLSQKTYFVKGKWVVSGPCDVNIRSNPSAEGGEDEGVLDDTTVEVVDFVDVFKLQEQPAFDKKQFLSFVRYIKLLT